MSSDLQSALESIRLNDYISVVVVTIVVYDCILTFPSEIEYIWKRRWASVSTLFVLVRYVGLMWAISGALFGRKIDEVAGITKKLCKAARSSFDPFASKLMYRYFLGNALNLLYDWTFPVFLGTVDLMMILRVYAMYHQSKTILAILLTIYIWEIVSVIVIAGIYSNPNTLQVTTVQLLDRSVCTAINTKPHLQTYLTVPQFIFGVLLCAFAIARFLRESLQTYKATNQLQINRFLQLLVREGVLYFFVNLFYIVITLINIQLTEIGTVTTLDLILGTTSFVLLYVLGPRFIINVRAAFSQTVLSDVNRGIDTGSGVTPSGRGERFSACAGPAMEFAAPRRDDEDFDGIEEMPRSGTRDLELM